MVVHVGGMSYKYASPCANEDCNHLYNLLLVYKKAPVWVLCGSSMWSRRPRFGNMSDLKLEPNIKTWAINKETGS